MDKFSRICRDIKSLKVQGAINVAKAGIKAYLLKPTEESLRKITSLRPTEPALFNSLRFIRTHDEKQALSHFRDSQDKINSEAYKIIKGNPVIYTHCHSSTVVSALVYAKNKGKKFSVISTETRPLFQGRKTVRELSRHRIPVSLFVDSAIHQAIKGSDIIFLGADAILESGVINKIGSGIVAEEADQHGKPLYILADSWKFYPKNLRIEERQFQEVWKRAPKNIKIRNPAFEKIRKRYISGIISEFGKMPYSGFIKKAKLSFSQFQK